MKILYLSESTHAYEIGDKIPLSASDTHHCLNVLRLKSGAPLTASDGRCFIYSGTLSIVVKHTEKNCFIEVKRKEKLEENRPRVHLHLSPIPKAMAETLLRYCTELGVYAVHWTLYERSQPHWTYAKVAGRFHKILQEAIKSTGRPTLPKLIPPTAFKIALAASVGVSLFGCTDPTRSLPLTNLNIPQFDDTHIWIGPEGDLSPAETEALVTRQAIPVSLGRTIYKVDTASLILLIQLNCKSCLISSPTAVST